MPIIPTVGPIFETQNHCSTFLYHLGIFLKQRVISTNRLMTYNFMVEVTEWVQISLLMDQDWRVILSTFDFNGGAPLLDL